MIKYKENKNDNPLGVVALELDDGTILTGRSSNLMSCSSAVVLNAINYLGRIEK